MKGNTVRDILISVAWNKWKYKFVTDLPLTGAIPSQDEPQQYFITHTFITGRESEREREHEVKLLIHGKKQDEL